MKTNLLFTQKRMFLLIVLMVLGLSSNAQEPLATAATNIYNTGFTANWSEVPGATEYRLDVSLLSTFGTSAPETTIVESFSGLDNSFSDYDTRTWMGNGGVNWTAYEARTDQTLGTNKAITLNSGTGSYLISDVITGGLNVVKFDMQNVLGVAGGTVTVRVFSGEDLETETIVGVYAFTSSFVSIESAALNISGDYILRIDNNSLTERPTIDNVSLATAPIFVPVYVPGFENVLVPGLSYDCDGLDPETPYYYRVRAVSGSGEEAVTSGNSNVIAVTTSNVNIWNGTSWSSGIDPDITQDVIIQGGYNTLLDGDFAALSLTVSADTLTVATGTSILIENEIIIEEGANMIVQNNANVIQNNDSAINSGSATVIRDSNSLFRQDYTLWSAPVTGQNIFDYSSGTVLSRFYTYNPETNHYVSMFTLPDSAEEGTPPPFDPETATFTIGQGYLIRMPNGSDVPGYIAGETPMIWNGEFNGTLNNGIIQAGQTSLMGGFNAIGNPYPSTIDADAFIDANLLKIDGTLYFWRRTNGAENAAAYATYTRVGGVSTAAATNPGEEGSNGQAPNGFIQAGQGFIVNVTPILPAIVGDVEFNNAMRVSNFNNQFFRNAAASVGEPQKHRIWLNMTNNSGIFSQALIGYVDGATNGIDRGMDGKPYAEDITALYSVVNSEKLTIQGRALPFTTEDIVPMAYKAINAGNYTIAIDHVDGLFVGQDIYLKDNLTGTVHNLKEGSYSFVTETGEFDSRFEVVYTATALGTDDRLDSDKIIVYKNDSAVIINSGGILMNDITIYDLQGRMIYNTNSINASEIVIDDLQAAEQVLIVTISTSNGKITKKIMY